MTDYIDRQAAIDVVSSMFAPTPTQKDMVEDCLEIIENLPSVEVEPVKGEWVKKSDLNGYYYACSECGKELFRRWVFDKDDIFPHLRSVDKTPYCPNCGAKMFNEKEEVEE